MKLKTNKVSYNPKTNEYTIDMPLECLGTLYGCAIYIDDTTPPITKAVVLQFLSEKSRYE